MISDGVDSDRKNLTFLALHGVSCLGPSFLFFFFNCSSSCFQGSEPKLGAMFSSGGHLYVGAGVRIMLFVAVPHYDTDINERDMQSTGNPTSYPARFGKKVNSITAKH
jgi:hypothetical protein